MAFISEAISFRRLAPAKRYSTLYEPAVGETANAEDLEEDNAVLSVTAALLEDGKTPEPTETEDVESDAAGNGEVHDKDEESGTDEAHGNAEPDCEEEGSSE